MTENNEDKYWPGAHNNKPSRPAAPPRVECCVKLDDKDNVIGGFVKKGPCMVKSTVISMAKAQCESLGSFLEVEAEQANDETMTENNEDKYWPGAHNNKPSRPAAPPRVECCVKLDDKDNVIG